MNPPYLSQRDASRLLADLRNGLIAEYMAMGMTLNEARDSAHCHLLEEYGCVPDETE